jgi:hypothetical protein
MVIRGMQKVMMHIITSRPSFTRSDLLSGLF